MHKKSQTIDLYWSFRSPYSYLVIQSVHALLAKWDVDINVKIVLPLALRQPSFFDSRGAAWMGYLVRDIARIAQMSGQTLAMPQPDPVVMDFKTGTFAKDQPLAMRLSYLGLAASAQGAGLEFIGEVSKIIWSGTPWEPNLGAAVARAGLDLDALEASLDSKAMDEKLDRHDKDLRAAGHWGVPTFAFEGEPFFGGDRIDALIWRLEQLGTNRKDS